MSLTSLRTSDKFCACVRRTWLMFAIVSVYILLGAVMFRHVEYEARDELVDDALEAIETERHNVLDVSIFFKKKLREKFLRFSGRTRS